MILSTPFPPKEGIGYYVYNLSRNLMKKGHKITVLTRGSIRSESELFENIKIMRLPYIPIYPLHVAIHGIFLNSFINKVEDDFDIFHLHAPLVPTIKTSKPIISTIHTSIIGDAPHLEIIDVRSLCIKILSYSFSKALIKNLLSKSKLVTTVSTAQHEELKNFYGYGTSIVIGNGVEDELFYPIDEHDSYLLYVGRLSYRKGLFDLVDAVKIVNQKQPLRFVIIGEGEITNKLMKTIKDNQLETNFIFKGHLHRTDLIDAYQRALLFVFPSYYEGLPTVLLEAMSCGLPVIATNIGGNSDVIKNLKNGLLVKPHSPYELANSIELLLANANLRKQLGEQARTTILDKFTWHHIADDFEKCYASLI